MDTRSCYDTNGPVSYEVKVGDQGVWNRHVEQIELSRAGTHRGTGGTQIAENVRFLRYHNRHNLDVTHLNVNRADYTALNQRQSKKNV